MHRAELRVVVNAGSILETNDQHGLAHSVEHMVFRGTKRFPDMRSTSTDEASGCRAGGYVVTTGQDETIYTFTVPTDRAGLVDTSLAILADMVSEATFDSVEARQEAGVVMEEWRSRTSAGRRMTEARNALLLAGSPYADRPTIGDTATLRRFDLAEMRRFYATWYRPELMVVVVAGDVNAGEVREELFASISAPFARGERPPHDRPRSCPCYEGTIGGTARSRSDVVTPDVVRTGTHLRSRSRTIGKRSFTRCGGDGARRASRGYI